MRLPLFDIPPKRPLGNTTNIFNFQFNIFRQGLNLIKRKHAFTVMAAWSSPFQSNWLKHISFAIDQFCNLYNIFIELDRMSIKDNIKFPQILTECLKGHLNSNLPLFIRLGIKTYLLLLV